MNILLVTADELDDEGRLALTGRRLAHVRDILGKRPGDTLRIGLRGGLLGEGALELHAEQWRIRCRFDTPPPPKRALTVVLALPRPPVLRRTLQHLTALGVERIVLLHTQRVEKSYWSSPALEDAAIAEQIDLGLEQAVDTVPPIVQQERRFRPFVEDRLVVPGSASEVWVADPRAERECPCDVARPVTLVVGPEGGFIPFELECLAGAGAKLVGLGPRILRVETAVIALVARVGGSVR